VLRAAEITRNLSAAERPIGRSAADNSEDES
jgi:hypothetical protein